MTRISTDRNGDGDYDDDVDTVAATDIDDVGRTEAKGEVTLEEGNHTFRVRTKLFKGWFRPTCALAISAAAGIGAAWYFGIEAISMGTVTKILLPIAIAGLTGCANPVLAESTYLVRVKAVEPTEDSTDRTINNLLAAL